MKLENKVAIVTGAAQGIGRAIALDLAKEGADIVVADIDLDQAAKTVADIKALGRRATFIKTNVVNFHDAQQMAKSTLDEFGKIDILVNNAGQGARERASQFYKSTEEVWDFVLSLNLKGVLNCCRSVIEPMMERKSGKIVNIASIAGVIGQTGIADYCAAKAGVIGFSICLAKEVASYGINVNCVSPGSITTRTVATMPKETYARLAKATGINRWAQPEEVAYMVTFLASDQANFITGQNFMVCGLLNYPLY